MAADVQPTPIVKTTGSKWYFYQTDESVKCHFSNLSRLPLFKARYSDQATFFGASYSGPDFDSVFGLKSWRGGGWYLSRVGIPDPNS